MNDSDDRLATAVWIPWILALAALFGWSVMTPDALSVGKGKRQDGTGLVQIADDQPVASVAPQPHTGIAPQPVGFGGLHRGAGELVRIEAQGESPAREFPRGGVQGRAPPEMA